MKAMVLAAGLGTRMRPLTNDRPKALIEVAGRPLLEIVLARLRKAGVTHAIVNAHHFAEMIADYVERHDFGIPVEISREETVLDTGGGLKQAAWFFRESGDDRDEPFLVHNVDIISTIDLKAMVRFHLARQALATLAVRRRASSRCLLFDAEDQLRGREAEDDSAGKVVSPSGSLQPLAFSGIHVLSPRIFDRMIEQSPFSIISAYVRLAAHRERILAFEENDAYWRDVGRPESVLRASEEEEQWSAGFES